MRDFLAVSTPQRKFGGLGGQRSPGTPTMRVSVKAWCGLRQDTTAATTTSKSSILDQIFLVQNAFHLVQMCAPDRKEWSRRKQCVNIIFFITAVVWSGYLATRSIVGSEIAFFVQSETNYLTSSVIPTYEPGKLCISGDAANEIDEVQQYVWLLAQHDLATSDAPFVEAAFDLTSSMPDLAQRGRCDLAAFLSPAQRHIH